MGQTYDTTLTLASNADDILDGVLTRTDTLRTSQSGSSAPSSPAAGWLWENTTSATDGVLMHYDGDAWVEVGSALHGDFSLGTSAVPYQLLYARLENRTSHIAAAAGQIGRTYLFTTDAKGRIIVSATVREVVMSASNVDFFGPLIPIGACDLDATNPPTAATVGTTPTIRGMQFDATNEKCSFGFNVPAGYGADVDCKVRVWAYLLNAETASDTIDATLTLVSLAPNANELASAASTTSTVAFSIGANNAQYSLQLFDFTLDFDDATNPINAGDWVECEFSLSSVASVAGIIVRGFQPLLAFGTKITE